MCILIFVCRVYCKDTTFFVVLCSLPAHNEWAGLILAELLLHVYDVTDRAMKEKNLLTQQLATLHCSLEVFNKAVYTVAWLTVR